MGNRLVDGNGRDLQLRGVNRAGLEYACIQGWGLFDGPSDDASVAAIAGWGANAVRLPLNEDCWLGIHTPNPAYSGQNYRDAVRGFVQRLHDFGMIAILDLQWAQLGPQPATGTLGKLPDAGHAAEFWTSVASTFVDDPSVIFDLYNEPHGVSWSCWRNGCTLPEGWAAAGMQSLVDAVRATGARQPIMVGGLDHANDLSGWLANAPVDPLAQLVASFHVYNFNRCRTSACWDRQVAPVAARVPVVAGEIGENDRGTALLDAFLPWADRHGISYLGWAWNVWADPIALISDYTGTPTRFGAGLRDHLLKLAPPRPAAVDGRVPVLSRGRPVFASSEVYPARNGQSDDYATVWRSDGYPCWLAYDLSSVPEPSRRRVYSNWSNINTSNYDSAVLSDRTYNVPADYVIEGNPGPGGTAPATSGWVTLVRVVGNTYHSAAHTFDMTGHNWLRFRATAGHPANAPHNGDCAIKWDVHDAGDGVPDSWIFYGDSISAAAMAPYPWHRDRNGTLVDSFAKLVHSARPSTFPAQQNGGVSGLTLDYTVSSGLFAKWLAAFPGKYVAISFGTNDANYDGFSPDAYYRNLASVVRLVEQAGKVAVIPTLFASRTKNVQANGPAANEKIREIYRNYPGVVPGPDLWSLFVSRPEWIDGDALHPNDKGYGEVRVAWVTSVLSSVYR